MAAKLATILRYFRSSPGVPAEFGPHLESGFGKRSRQFDCNLDTRPTESITR